MVHMENLAIAFDLPVESREHQDLATTAWMGGILVAVRYWLGRLLRRNLFRESDDVVNEALRKYIVEIGCKKGAQLVDDHQSWSPVATFLQSQVEVDEGQTPTKNRKLVAAIHAVLKDPDLTVSELAAIANTTEKQITRMTDVFILRKLWRLHTA